MNTPAWITTLLGGGALSAVATYLSGRQHGRAEFLNATTEAADIVMRRIQEECERVHDRCSALEAREDQCRKDLAQVKDDLAEVRRISAAKIDALMKGQVAPYDLGPRK